jgi:hypothetical protein
MSFSGIFDNGFEKRRFYSPAEPHENILAYKFQLLIPVTASEERDWERMKMKMFYQNIERQQRDQREPHIE